MTLKNQEKQKELLLKEVEDLQKQAFLSTKVPKVTIFYLILLFLLIFYQLSFGHFGYF